MTRILLLAAFIAAPLLIGFVGSVFTTPQIPGWYAGLIKPDLNPPSWIFGPVWTTLYILMGIASYRVYLKRAKFPKLTVRAFSLYAVHLLVNLSWSLVFFAAQSPMGAVWMIGLLWVMIVALIGMFARIDKLAALLLVPYLAWVTFATYLNISIALIN